MTVTYHSKDCLFCTPGQQKLRQLYPQTFGDKDLEPAVFSARRTTEHYHYSIVRCDNCELVFSKDILDDKTLENLYGESTVTFGDIIPILMKDYWAPLSRHTQALPAKSAAEIGCSSGFFLDKLLAEGFDEVHGFEPSVDAKNKASAKVKPTIYNCFFNEKTTKEHLGDKKLGLVCSFQTLDHVSEPLAVLDAVRDALLPNGLCYFITHNVDALQAKILKDKSPIIDIEHIYLFNKKTLSKLVEKKGFKVLEVGNLRNSYPLEYWLKMLPVNKPLKESMRFFLKYSGLLQWAPSLSAGNIFVIAQKTDA